FVLSGVSVRGGGVVKAPASRAVAPLQRKASVAVRVPARMGMTKVGGNGNGHRAATPDAAGWIPLDEDEVAALRVRPAVTVGVKAAPITITPDDLALIIKEIDAAIDAHAKWKMRIYQAISDGTIDTPVEKIAMDNQCAFGKWLHGLPAATKAAGYAQQVLELHKEFHKTAARIVQLALSGNKAEAERLMGASSDYAAISSRLTRALLAWKSAMK
ncbi:MAG: CZB domain-containing protein, partial [Chloroflexi bacterium]|nr:CZB domain-containing protein [Chloroflexota bacterium]